MNIRMYSSILLITLYLFVCTTNNRCLRSVCIINLTPQIPLDAQVFVLLLTYILRIRKQIAFPSHVIGWNPPLFSRCILLTYMKSATSFSEDFWNAIFCQRRDSRLGFFSGHRPYVLRPKGTVVLLVEHQPQRPSEQSTHTKKILELAGKSNRVWHQKKETIAREIATTYSSCLHRLL